MKKEIITRISNQHLLNRIKYFKRILESQPLESTYIGGSEFAEDAVEQENRANEIMTLSILAHIKYMEKEAKKRLLKFPQDGRVKKRLEKIKTL